MYLYVLKTLNRSNQGPCTYRLIESVFLSSFVFFFVFVFLTMQTKTKDSANLKEVCGHPRLCGELALCYIMW